MMAFQQMHKGLTCVFCMSGEDEAEHILTRQIKTQSASAS
jgi:hypothetical protein